jgi:hypothetical protein
MNSLSQYEGATEKSVDGGIKLLSKYIIESEEAYDGMTEF